MKKILISGIGLFLLVGCASNNLDLNKNVNQNIKTIKLDKKLMSKYHITTNNLIKFGKYIYFLLLDMMERRLYF